MIERLQVALSHVEGLPEEAQEEIAELIEELAQPFEQDAATPAPPESDRPADTVIAHRYGMADFPDDVDVMFDELDRIRHESVPTPPILPSDDNN